MPSCLVVDASHVVRTVMRNILEELGYAVTEAASGRGALQHCRTAPPQLVLLDWDLPDMPGRKLVESLRGEGQEPAPAFVFCTRRDKPAEIAEAVRDGAAEYIIKPFDGDVVRARLRLAGLVP